MLADNAVSAEHEAAAIQALAVAGYDGFDVIGFSRGPMDSGTRGAFIAKGAHCLFVAPDASEAQIMKATDDEGEDSVKRVLANLKRQVDTPIAQPVEIQTQTEFDYTPSSDGGTAPDAEPAVEKSDLDKSLAALRAANAAFAPAPVAVNESSSLEQDFLKSVGARCFTPALRLRFAQYLAPKLAEQMVALQRARDAL